MIEMRRAVPVVALVVVCLFAGVASGVVVPAGGPNHGASVSGGPGAAETATTNETANETTPGATLSGAVVAEERTLDGQLQARNYDVRLTRANTTAQRIAVLDTISTSLSAEVARIERTRNTTLTGMLSPGKRTYLETGLRVDATVVAQIAASSADAARQTGNTTLASQFDQLSNESVSLTEGLLGTGILDIDADTNDTDRLLDGDGILSAGDGLLNDVDETVNDTDGTLNDTDGTLNGTDGMLNDTDGIFNDTNGTDGTLNDSNGTLNDTDGTFNDSDGTLNDSDGTLNDSDGTLQQTVNDTDGTLNDTDGTLNDSDGMVNGTDVTLNGTDSTSNGTDGTLNGTDGTLSVVGVSRTETVDTDQPTVWRGRNELGTAASVSRAFPLR